MAASNDNSGKIHQSEKEVSDANLGSSKAGEQLQELLTILTEFQLLKKSKKEPSELKLPLSEKSVQRLEDEENRRKQLSFRIESPSIIPEVLTNEEEIPSQRRQNNNEESDVSIAGKVAPKNRPSEEELEQAVEEFKRLQQLLFERDLPEFYSNVLSVEQRLENFEKLMSDPEELMIVLKPLIPELVRDELDGLKLELKKAIDLASNNKINPIELEAKLADWENQIANLNQQPLPNKGHLMKRLMPLVGDLLNRKVEEYNFFVMMGRPPRVNQVIHNQNG